MIDVFPTSQLGHMAGATPQCDAQPLTGNVTLVPNDGAMNESLLTPRSPIVDHHHQPGGLPFSIPRGVSLLNP